MKKKIFLFIKLYILDNLRRILFFLRRIFFMTFRGVNVGVGTKLGSNVTSTFYAELRIGNDGYICSDVSFEVGRLWERCKGLTIGDRIWISRGCLLQCAGRIEIGDDVLIGEYTSIRDTQHGSDRNDIPIRSQVDVIGEIKIEDNVWIGRGCLILGKPGGIILGTGSIIGANSVVTKSIPPNTIWGGVPARQLRSRFAINRADG